MQEASRIKDDFLASLSHELRTPLNAILGYAHMLRSGLVPPDRRDKAVETIERNATSLAQIVDDVLDVSRIVAGKIRLNVQPVDLPHVVRNAIDAMTPAADAKGVRIETVLDPEAGPISGDPERLQQVLWNLLSNGVKFTNRGGRVQVRLERVNSHVEIVGQRHRHRDRAGVPAACLRAVPAGGLRNRPGARRTRSGPLNRPSADRDARRHHRRLERWRQSGRDVPRENPGDDRPSRPRRRPADPSSRERRAPERFALQDLRDVRVLAVDDEADALSLVSEVLQAAGAHVSTARSAEEALTILETDVPDVVVADLGMPHVDGFQFIDRVRRHRNPLVREVPAAALTAYARSEDRTKALSAGFQIHLAKPIDPAELVTTIASLARRFVVGRGGRPSDLA